MKKLAIGFIICVLGIMVFVIYALWPPEDVLALGNFVILSLTLSVLICYAYDTNSIARIGRDRWKRESVLSTMYSMELKGEKGGSGKTMVRIHNQSTLVVHAVISCNFRVYGEQVKSFPAYEGEEPWLAFPQQVIQGFFEIKDLLQKKGKNVQQMISESTPVNRKDQLTMNLMVEFQDELGTKRKLPSRRHYFDFDRWAWIPHITVKTKLV